MDKKYDPHNLLIRTHGFDVSNKEDEQKSKSRLEETIAERVKLRGQEADEEGLSDMSQQESNGKKVKKGKVLKLLPQTNC